MLEPAGHRVLVKVKKFEEKTAGGIYIPKSVADTHTRASTFGTVVAVGSNAWKSFDDGHAWASVGDLVSFVQYGGVTIEDPDTHESFCMLNDEDILAVVRSNG